MYMARFCSLTAIVPISLLLTVSFFVLFTLRKVTDKWLKALGYLALGFLLLAALVVFSGAVVNSARGLGLMRCPMGAKMQKCGMMERMRDKGMPEMPMPDKGMPPREQ